LFIKILSYDIIIEEGDFMKENILSLILPFLGTVIGSAFVFFFKKKMSSKMEKIS
jgi:hypothetical protein